MTIYISEDDKVALDDLIEKVREVIRAAFERGVTAGMRRARDDLSVHMNSFLNNLSEPPDLGAPAPQSEDDYGNVRSLPSGATGGRAPRGSVEPRILRALIGVRGKKPGEIARETGIPENSVRGSLNRMRKDGRVFKVGEVWRPAGPQLQLDGSTVEVTAAGTLIETPAHLVRSKNPDAKAPG